MSAAAVVLPFVWATARIELVPGPAVEEVRRKPIPYEMAFYRKYTEAILQRYVRMSMESGKVPSLLGQDMFRGWVTSYRVKSFDDVVIFVHDVETCIKKLDIQQQRVISHLALQQYSVGETAEMMGLPPRTVIRRYSESLDRLTRIFLSVRMLERQHSL